MLDKTKMPDSAPPLIKKIESFHKKELPLEEIIEKVPVN